jgi:16S rRNA (adenine1518-N6/adenine1519-N6)-dimethyltransferase
MQRLGQHFLKNQNVIAKITGTIAPRNGDVVLEIGPGHGELTKELLNANHELRMICMEKDAILCKDLGILFKDDQRVEIICGDALKQLPLLVSKFRNSGISKYLLVGNIPYYITGHLFRIVGELKNKPERAVFMIQKEVAERLIARPPKMNRLAASVQFWAEPKIIVDAPKRDFMPAPKVDSAVILLKPQKGHAPCETENYYAAVRAIFGQPRKTVLNNILNDIKTKQNDHHKRDDVISALMSIGIDPESRPQNLSIENIKAVAEMFF